MKFATKTHKKLLSLGMLLSYIEKLKIPILCRYSADTEENANRLLEIILRVSCPRGV